MSECAAILAAEVLYGKLVCDGVTFFPGCRVTFEWIPDDRSPASWRVEAEVLANAVWRRGRLFFRCAACGRRATRLYVPVVGVRPRCRRCWGLDYESQSWSYHGDWWARIPCYVTTEREREERQQAALARYDARRAFLVAAARPQTKKKGL